MTLTFPDLLDVGFVLVLMIVAIALAALFGVWMKGGTRRSGRRGKR